MPGLVPGDVVEVTIEGALLGQRTMNVFYYAVSVGSTSNNYVTAMTNLLTDYLQSATGPLLPILSATAQNWVSQNIRGQRIWPTRDIALFKTDGRPGLRPFDCEVSNIAAVITKHGPFGTRHDVGSYHMPGLSDADYGAGEITPAQKVLMANIGARFIQNLVVAGDATTLNPVLSPKANPAAYRVIIAFGVRDEIRVMRRRTLRVGV